MLDTNRSWTQRALLLEGERVLAQAGVEDARRNAEWLLRHVLSCSRAALYAYPERPVGEVAGRTFAGLIARRAAREPLQYVLGYTEFYGLRLGVTPDVLIPRPETEQVVEEALVLLRARRAPRVLDVGTGSGCIALALKHERPDAEVFACDVSAAALEVAGANAGQHGLQVHLLQADLRAPDFSSRVPDRLDLLISNPPYIALREAASLGPEVRDHEPHLALFAGEDPLRFYRLLVRQARLLLVPGGHVVFETHAAHGAAVRDLLKAAGFPAPRLKPDLAGLPRIVTAVRP